MKDFKEYIDDQIIEEGLLKWFKAFFTRLYDKYSDYIDRFGNDIKPIDLEDEDQIRYNRTAVALSEVEDEVIKFWKSNKYGYPYVEDVIGITSLAKVFKHEMVDPRKHTFMYEFFYKGTPKIPCVLILFSDLKKKENYRHILYININPYVNNKTEILDYIFDLFVNITKKKSPEIKGFITDGNTYKGYSTLIEELGFKKSDDELDSGETYLYDIK